MIILPILATSLIHFLFKEGENVLFDFMSERVNLPLSPQSLRGGSLRVGGLGRRRKFVRSVSPLLTSPPHPQRAAMQACFLTSSRGICDTPQLFGQLRGNRVHTRRWVCKTIRPNVDRWVRYVYLDTQHQIISDETSGETGYESVLQRRLGSFDGSTSGTCPPSPGLGLAFGLGLG